LCDGTAGGGRCSNRPSFSSKVRKSVRYSRRRTCSSVSAEWPAEEWYLSIHEGRDVLEMPIVGELDAEAASRSQLLGVEKAAARRQHA